MDPTADESRLENRTTRARPPCGIVERLRAADTQRMRLSSLIAILAALIVFTPGPAPAGRTDTNIGQGALERVWRESWSLMERTRLKGDLPFQDCFEKAARRYDLPLPLLFAVARGESNFNPRAVSSKSCLGVMQIKWPGTARSLGIMQKKALFDPCTNIDAGARYLAGLVRLFRGNLYRALAAYNYGPGAIRPGRIPDGAHWYASYIHKHLRHVLSSSRLKMPQGVIRTFDSFHEAAFFVDYLNTFVPDLRIRISARSSHTFQVYFTYESPDERQNVIQQLIRKTGIKPQTGGYS